MGIRDLLPGGASARDRDERLRERLEEEADRLEELDRREAALQEKSVSATVAGDEEEAADLREQRLRLRLEIEDREAARERIREELEEVEPAALEEEAREVTEKGWNRLATAKARAADLEDAMEAVVAGPGAELAEAYRRMLAAARRAAELERELEEEHGVALDLDRPTRVDRRLRQGERRGWRALELLRKWDDGSRR